MEEKVLFRDARDRRNGEPLPVTTQLHADQAANVLARVHVIPPVRVAQHVDEPRIHEHIARMLAARRRLNGLDNA